MADENVKIVYEAVVRGMQQVEELARKNEQLQGENDKMAASVKRLSQEHEKQQSTLIRAQQAVRLLRREMAVFGFALGTLAATMALLSKGSSNLASAMEELGREAAIASRPMGDFMAKFIRLMGGKGFTSPDLSISNQARLAGMFSDIESLRGNTQAALLEKLRAEEITTAQQVGDKWQTTFKRVFDERKKLLMENLQLEELGLKRMSQIQKDFKKDTVQGLRGGVSDTLFNFLQGEKQSGADILKNFMTPLNRAVSEAFSQALFTTFASGGNFFQNFKNIFTGRSPAAIAAENTAKATASTDSKMSDLAAILRQIAECTCSTARSVGGGITGTITPPKASGLQKASSILGAVSLISGLGAGLMPTPTPTPVLTFAPQTKLHNGGWVPHFSSGGEVPAMVQPQEFVVRRSAALKNRDILKEINAGGEPVRGAQNVFLIKANDAESFAAMLSSPSARAQLEIQIMRAISLNGGLRDVIRSYGR